MANWTAPSIPVIFLNVVRFRPGVRMISKCLRGLAATVLLWPAIGLAQVPTSTADIIPNTSRPSESNIARSDRAFRDLVRCVVRYQPDRTRNLLATIPGTHAEELIFTSLNARMESCYNFYITGAGALFMNSTLLRGVVAETYLAQEAPGGFRPASGATAEQLAAWAQPRAEDNRIGQLELLHATARCVIGRQPAGVGALLRTEPLSREERAAFGPLQPDLSACLDSGVEFTASRQSLRALLAEAAYHYLESSRSGFAPSVSNP